jgi:hypothetical protein
MGGSAIFPKMPTDKYGPNLGEFLNRFGFVLSLQIELRFLLSYFYFFVKKLPPHTLAGFDLATARIFNPHLFPVNPMGSKHLHRI